MGKMSEKAVEHNMENARRARAMLKGVDYETAFAITELLRAFEQDHLYSARFGNLTLRARRQLEKLKV